MKLRITAATFLIFITSCSSKPPLGYAYQDDCYRPQWKSEGFKYVTNSISSCLNDEYIELDGSLYQCVDTIPYVPSNVHLISKISYIFNSSQSSECAYYYPSATFLIEPSCQKSTQNPNNQYTDERFKLIEHEMQIKIYQILLANQSAFEVIPELQEQPDGSSLKGFIGCLWENTENSSKVYYRLPI